MSSHHGSSVGPALVAGLALLAPIARPARAQQQIGMGRTVTGTLGAADPVLPPGQAHYRMFSFYGTAGQTVQIDLVSAEFDAHLALQDPLGQKVADDEDGGGGRNARIWYTMPTTGMYLVLAGARRADEGGAFTLTVVATRDRPPPPPPPPPASAPAPTPAPAEPAPSLPTVAPPPAAQPVAVAPPAADTTPTRPSPPQLQPAPPPAVDTTPERPAPTQEPAVTAPPPQADTTPAKPAPVQPQPVLSPPQPTPADTTPAKPIHAPARPSAPQPVVTPPPPRADTTPTPAPAPAPAEPAPTAPNPVQLQPVAPPVTAPPVPVPTVAAPPLDAIPTNAIPAPGEIGLLAFGQTMRGMLGPGDQTMADGTYSDTWQFQGTAGQTVTIEVRSTAFGTYAQLFDPGGNRVAEDIGSGGGNNSRVVYRLQAAGMYQVVVVNAEGQKVTGLYTISIR